MRKTAENACRWPTKCKKRWKMLVVGRRNTEIAGKCPSSVDETLDLPKIIRHPWMKAKKRQKIPVIRGWKRKNAETPWKQKNSLKMAFSPYGKLKNSLKTAFSPYGKRKNSLKTALSPYEKHKNTLKSALPPYGKCKKSLKTAFPPYGKHKNSLKTTLPPYGKRKNSPKMTFPKLGHEENAWKQLSQYWETKKTGENKFPKVGKQKDWCLNRIRVYISI